MTSFCPNVSSVQGETGSASRLSSTMLARMVRGSCLGRLSRRRGGDTAGGRARIACSTLIASDRGLSVDLEPWRGLPHPGAGCSRARGRRTRDGFRGACAGGTGSWVAGALREDGWRKDPELTRAEPPGWRQPPPIAALVASSSDMPGVLLCKAWMVALCCSIIFSNFCDCSRASRSRFSIASRLVANCRSI